VPRLPRSRPARRISALSAIAVALALPFAGPAEAVDPLVALGDSFSSGEGAPPFQTGTAKPGVNTCHRSRVSWTELVGDATGRPVESVACSGAKVEHIVRTDRTREQEERETSQITRLRRLTPGVVTITIGGNDVGFAKVLRKCVTALRHCDDIYRKDGKDVLEDSISTLGSRLPGVYRRVLAAASGAPLVVVGYPRIFPAKPELITCAWMTADELRYLNAKSASLNAAIRRAAARAGASYIDVSGVLEGHELSCRGGSWVNPLGFTPTKFPYSFHPKDKGYAALAEAVERRLRRLGLD
jgi:lysophospholipase L1-like esterase